MFTAFHAVIFSLYAVLFLLCAVAYSLYVVLFSLCTEVKSLYAVPFSCRTFFPLYAVLLLLCAVACSLYAVLSSRYIHGPSFSLDLRRGQLRKEVKMAITTRIVKKLS